MIEGAQSFMFDFVPCAVHHSFKYHHCVGLEENH
jgi:hypothetical protein